MKKTLITYSLSGRKNALELTRKIYGFTDLSNHGRYKYQRKGILTNIPHEKISRATFWVDPKYKIRIIKEFKKIGLKIKTIDIILPKTN